MIAGLIPQSLVMARAPKLHRRESTVLSLSPLNPSIWGPEVVRLEAFEKSGRCGELVEYLEPFSKIRARTGSVNCKQTNSLAQDCRSRSKETRADARVWVLKTVWYTSDVQHRLEVLRAQGNEESFEN